MLEAGSIPRSSEGARIRQMLTLPCSKNEPTAVQSIFKGKDQKWRRKLDGGTESCGGVWPSGISHRVDSGQRRGEEKLLSRLTCAREEAASTTICHLLSFSEHGEGKPCEARKERKRMFVARPQGDSTRLPHVDTMKLFSTVFALILATTN